MITLQDVIYHNLICLVRVIGIDKELFHLQLLYQTLGGILRIPTKQIHITKQSFSIPMILPCFLLLHIVLQVPHSDVISLL